MCALANPELAPDAELTLDRLVGEWRIYQLKRGHRFSTDDLMCAWRASVSKPDARRILDLGSGIGSVGLYTLGLLGHAEATLVGLEAQKISHALALRTVAHNGLSSRVQMRLGDLRDLANFETDEVFDLVTGSPPYIPPHAGVHSPEPQRAACRMELRGSVLDYCKAARPRLAPGGRFSYVMAARDPRTEQAPIEAGLAVLERFDVVFREGEPAMITVMTCANRAESDLPARTDRVMVIRDAQGGLSPAYQAFRVAHGFAVPETTR